MKDVSTPWLRRACLSASGVLGVTLAHGQGPALQHEIPSPPVPSGSWQKSTFEIARTDHAPKIDGKLDDPCWATALHANGFFRFRSMDPVREQTEAWICADRNRLYLAFHCHDSHPELIRANETQRDGNIDHDDYVGIAIDSQGNRRNVSQFTVTARGTQVTQLEGGTAENLSWAGDWTSGVQRVADGWTAEISIPFALLRYPRGAHNFPLALVRQISRETNAEIWPYIPMGSGDVNPLQYLNDFTGVEPPYYAPRFVFLPYVLGTTGSATGFREGLDVKYPISTTLTGVATLFPDFETVEQAVQDLSFSYTEKFVPDRRPFFAEGNRYWPDSFLFYSQRIQNVDAGLKVVGKQGPTTIGALATTADGGTGQSAFVARGTQDLGLLSQVGATVLGTNIDGLAANRVGRIEGNYGWTKGGRQVMLTANETNSWLAGGKSDYNDFFQISTDAGHNQIGGNAFYTETGPNFVNQLGLVPEVDVRGGGATLMRNGAYDKGSLERDFFMLNGSTFRHMTGGFFHDSLSLVNYFSMRNGWDYELDLDTGKREAFHDDTITGYAGWNQKSLFRRGFVRYQMGHRENMPYQFLDINQGVLLSKQFSLAGDFNQLRLGTTHDTQTILSGTYRFNQQDTFGGRLVQHDGKVNAYVSFGRRTRHGTDIFVLVGDPNSRATRGVVTVKLVRPF